MPQLSLLRDRQPYRFEVDYRTNPLKPHEDPKVSIMVKDQLGDPIDVVLVSIPEVVLFEAVADILRAAWEAYLFGEVGSVRRAVAGVRKAWMEEAKVRRSVRS